MEFPLASGSVRASVCSVPRPDHDVVPEPCQPAASAADQPASKNCDLSTDSYRSLLIGSTASQALRRLEPVTYHLNRAMDNGLTQVQAAEVITHLAFYAGWPNTFSALPVTREVFATRAGAGTSK